MKQACNTEEDVTTVLAEDIGDADYAATQDAHHPQSAILFISHARKVLAAHLTLFAWYGNVQGSFISR